MQMRGNVNVQHILDSVSNYDHFSDAFVEIILNCIQEAALNVWVYVYKNTIIIVDDGMGMTREMVQAFNDTGFSIKRGQGLDTGGYHNVGSKAWMYFADRCEVHTLHNSRVGQDTPVWNFVIYKPDIREIPFGYNVTECGVPHSEFSPEVAGCIQDGNFTIQKFNSITHQGITADKLTHWLSRKLPPGLFANVIVNGQQVPIRTYEGEPLRLNWRGALEDEGGTPVEFSAEFYAVDRPTALDRVRIMIQQRLRPLSDLTDRLEVPIPEVYFNSHLAATITANCLTPYTQGQRGLRHFDAPIFFMFVNALEDWETQVSQLVGEVETTEEEREHRSRAAQIANTLSQALSELDLNVDEVGSNRRKCPICPDERTAGGQHHNCRALQLDADYTGPVQICTSCCRQTWQAVQNSGEPRITGCRDNLDLEPRRRCSFFGRELTRQTRDTGEERPPRQSVIIEYKGHKFPLQFTSGDGERLCWVRDRNVIIDINHPLYQVAEGRSQIYANYIVTMAAGREILLLLEKSGEHARWNHLISILTKTIR